MCMCLCYWFSKGEAYEVNVNSISKPVAGDDVITCCYGKGRVGVILDSNNQDGR